ncbi:hypothetical protein OGATHE_005219 [Ogataea polymorpha]|uniref:Uncharacterized protein n=1 Tax=Ogataea polymorpha TaxID=460523 RepID=A0A9P8NWH3_9ASCO|nr:hypothetical protein OGATHE_005219 [Ogataea polymorpha]
MSAARRFRRDSATHILAEAAAEIRAKVGFSPIARASPVDTTSSPREVAVTPTSATGTCHGPTNWSRSTKPVTVLSPMVIRNDLDPTEGSCNTLLNASSREVSEAMDTGSSFGALEVSSRDIFGGLPNSRLISKSIGLQILLTNSQDKSLLRFVTPDLKRRHSWFQRENFSELKLGTKVIVVNQLRQGIRQSSCSHVVDTLNRRVGAVCITCIDNLLCSSLHLWIASLDGRKVQIFTALAGCDR